MAYQLSDLVSKVITRSKDPSFSRDLIAEYIDETQKEVLGYKRFTFMEASGITTLPAGEREVSLGSTVQAPIDLALTDGTQESRPTYEPQREFYGRPSTSTAGRPNRFTAAGRKLYFNTPADVSYDVEVVYLKAPDTLEEDDDVPEIPQEFGQILILGGLAGVEEYRENYDIASLHRRKIEDLTSDMLTRYGLRQIIHATKMPRPRFRRGTH